MLARKCRRPTPFSFQHGGPASRGPARKDGCLMTSAAIYARVSSARQKKDQTIGSQTQALREHATQSLLEVPEEWVFEDEGHSGATLVRPGLEALRDLAAQGCLDVVLCYSPDRLARKFAYQALLIEEFTRSGVRAEFVKGPRGDTPEDQLMVQFQGMFAEDEAALVAEMFRRYADDGASIAGLARWLTSQGVPTRTGKARWDRSVIWGMLRNPAYAGTAVFGKTQVLQESPGLNRVARLQGRRFRGRPGPWTGPRGMGRHPRPGHRRHRHLRPGSAAAGRQQALRRPQHQGPVPSPGPGRLLGVPP